MNYDIFKGKNGINIRFYRGTLSKVYIKTKIFLLTLQYGGDIMYM